MRREFHVRFCEGGGVRFPSATRLIVGFQYRSDAEQFLKSLRERLRKFSLQLHPEKTRLLMFGAAPSRNKAPGYELLCVATSLTMQYPPTGERCCPSEPRSSDSGSGRCGAAASETGRTGRRWAGSFDGGYRPPASGIPGSRSDLTSGPEARAQCGSSARWELCGGRPDKGRPYRDRSGGAAALLTDEVHDFARAHHITEGPVRGEGLPGVEHGRLDRLRERLAVRRGRVLLG